MSLLSLVIEQTYMYVYEFLIFNEITAEIKPTKKEINLFISMFFV